MSASSPQRAAFRAPANQASVLGLVAMTVWQAAAMGAQKGATAAPVHPAIPFIERSIIEMRIDPEASRRDAEGALKLLERQPDADLEIRARLVLCDYQAERDTAAAEQQIELATALLAHARR